MDSRFRGNDDKQDAAAAQAALQVTLSSISEFVDRNPALASLALVALALLTHIVILVAPGFFSGDEWQKFDAVQSHGFWHFAQAYGALSVGKEFGHPVRP